MSNSSEGYSKEPKTQKIRLKAVFLWIFLLSLLGLIVSTAIDNKETKKVTDFYESIKSQAVKLTPQSPFDYFLLASGIGLIGYIVTPWASKQEITQTLDELMDSQKQNSKKVQSEMDRQQKNIETLFNQVSPIKKHNARLTSIEQNPIVKQGEVLLGQEEAKMELLNLIREQVKLQTINFNSFKEIIDGRLNRLEAKDESESQE